MFQNVVYIAMFASSVSFFGIEQSGYDEQANFCIV
jgi:hypothetical protein